MSSRYIDIMPLTNDYQEFKKYMLKVRKELNIKLKWVDKNNTLIINDTSVYFTDYKCAMCYLEGIKKGVEINDNRRR